MIKTNKEGLAAKLYFSSMFGPLFKRHQADDVNKYLNYGYTILLSMFNRRIKILWIFNILRLFKDLLQI